MTESVETARHGLVTKPPKNGKPRTLRVDTGSIEVLSEHIREYPSENGLLFTSTEGQQVRHRNFMSRHFTPALREVDGLPTRFTFPRSAAH